MWFLSTKGEQKLAKKQYLFLLSCFLIFAAEKLPFIDQNYAYHQYFLRLPGNRFRTYVTYLLLTLKSELTIHMF